MQCSKCGHDNRSGAKFCEQCATPLALACPQCGSQVSSTAKFCPECAHPLAAAAEPRLASPKSYTPKHLAEKILTSRAAMEGEKKPVTVLFCDIVESSQLAQRLAPETMHQVMNRALHLMAEAVHRYDGTVNQFLGDGLMALFGAPMALEDHAYRGIQAALAIRETLSGYGEQLKQEKGVELRVRVGLNTGQVVVGRIGDDLRMDYTAVGATTHLASRLQSLAEPGTILISEATLQLTEGYIRCEALGPMSVKGWNEPLPVFRVLGRRRGRTRLEVSVERGLSQLVGRERELGLLKECLARAQAGHGQVVGLVGEPGVGKSRLLYEFRKSLEGERVTWLEGHCVAWGQTTPFLPVLEVLRSNFQIEEGDNPLQVQEKLREGIHRLDPSLERLLPFFHELFGVPGAGEALKHQEPKEKRQKTFEAIRALTVAGCQRRTHVLILEDLHWIDKTSEDYVGFLIAGLARLPILLVTTQRPGYSVRWADRTYYTQIALDLLSERDSEALVAALLGSTQLPADLLRIVREKAEGNPLFVEEIAASLQERGMIVRRNGEIQWSGGAGLEFPDTIQDIIRARIDRLEEPVKRTVQTASVIGREFGLSLLARVSEVEAQVQPNLDVLTHTELIHETRFYPELEYIFKHAVTQDVAYQSLLAQRRKDLHGAIGRALEELYADRPAEQAPILAYHYARSEQQEKAIEYALIAGDQAAGRLYASAEARIYYQEALSAAQALPLSPAARRWQIDATLKRATVAMSGRDIEHDRIELEHARQLGEALQDEARLAQVLYWLGRLTYVKGEPRKAMAFARQSLEIADRLGDDALAAPPVNLLGRVCFVMSDYGQAGQLLARNVEQMRRIGNRIEEATAAGSAGHAFAWIGEFERAVSYADQGVELAQATQNPAAEAAAHMYRGEVHMHRGEWSVAVGDFEQAGLLAERAGDLFRVYMTKFWEGHARSMAGDPTRGRTLLEEAGALAQRLGTKFILAWQKIFLAHCFLALGDPAGALRVSEEAKRLADESDDKWATARAHRAYAEALLRLDPSQRDKPERDLLEGIRILREIGTRPELARSYLSYARLLKDKGDPERARAHLAEAIAMFRDMGMLSDLERAEEALG